MKTTDLTTPTPLAIIGIGCMFPQAKNLESYWANLKNGLDTITEIPKTHWRVEDYFHENPKAPDLTYARRGGFLPPVDFNPLEFGISPHDIEATDTSQLLGLMVAQDALRDAGYGPGVEFNRERTSVILGVTGTLELVIPLGARLGHPIWRRAMKESGLNDALVEDIVQRISNSYVDWQENSFPGLLGNVVAGRIANRLDLGGTNCVVDAACASSLSALHLAQLELSAGRSDLVVTGGVDTFNDIFMYMCFSKTPALSPTGNARPFDRKGDGTILGEGLGMMVIKRLEEAKRDGNKIYAIIRSVASSSDGKGNAIYAPSAKGQAKALTEAYQLAQISPTTVDLVEAHGTGTKVGDATEVTALTEVYRRAQKEGTWCALGSVKSQIGHTKAAAGIAGLIKAALALHHKVLPPTLKVDEPLEILSPGQTPFYLNTEKRPWMPRSSHPRRAAVSSFGFGGSNFHCVLEEYGSEATKIDWEGEVQILPFSAKSKEELASQLKTWPAQVSWEEFRIKAAEARENFKSEEPFRLVLVVEKEKTDLTKALANAQTLLQTQGEKKSWAAPEGLYFGQGSFLRKLGLLFPGQGSQYVGMLRDLACGFPKMQQVLKEADRVFIEGKEIASDKRLTDFIYPIPVFNEEDRAKNEIALRATEVAQPALGAVSVGALKILEDFGLPWEGVAGHSYGELVALHAAGRIESDDLHSLSKLRGRLMAEGAGDRGSMLAVQAPSDSVEKIMEELRLELIVANKNAPLQSVLSGPSAEMERAAEALTQRGISNKRLPVSAAFHSPLVAEARGPFLSALNKISFSEAQIPVFSNCNAEEYPHDSEKARLLLADQLVTPVEFVQQIENMYQAGIRSFLEVGPGSRLTGLVKAILGDKEHEAFALDASSGKRSGIFDLGRTLAQLAALGFPLELTRWDGNLRDQSTRTDDKKPLMTISICGANSFKPKPQKPVVSPSPVMTSPLSPPPISSPSVSPSQSPSIKIESSSLQEALKLTQDSLSALLKLQEQTARLHQQFLEGQEAAQRNLQALIEQQQRLSQGSFELKPVLSKTSPEIPPRVTELKSIPTSAPLPAEEKNISLPSSSTDRVETVLMEVISEKTGYPVEMFHLDMGLDSDLGIDSIKRVEILSSLKDKLPEAPVIKPDQMGTLKTLRQIVEFLSAGRATLASSQSIPTNPSPSAKPGSPQIESVLLEVISEKTGYPVEMFHLDMGLDSDLGIDSIKRVEILSSLKDKLPEAPVIKPDQMGALKTLRQIVEFLSNPGSPSPTPQPDAVLKNLKPEKEAPRPDSLPLVLERSILSPVLLDESLPRKTFSLSEGSEIWVTEENSGLAFTLVEQLKTLKLKPKLISWEDLKTMQRPLTLGGLLIVAPAQGGSDEFLKNAFRLVQLAGPSLKEAGKNGGSFLVTLSRLGGSFGLSDRNPDQDPIGGGLAGLSKTAHQEWKEVHCKALDLTVEETPSALASQVIEEIFLQGPLEVGLSQKGRRTLKLIPSPLPAKKGKAPFSKQDVLVITGGARGVTAEIVVAFAEAFQSRLVLLGRSPTPKPEPEGLSSLTQEAEIKKALLTRANGLRSPKEIEQEYQALTAGREIRRNIARMEAFGSRVIYHSVDIRDFEAVNSVIEEVRSNVGPIRGLVHGAGVIADRLILDKTEEQFEEVYSTKIKGLRSLLTAIPSKDLKAMVFFSSTTARYGRSGQVDYAMANEVLNKMALQQAGLHPTCRVISVNWGPWEGGMVTPSLKKVFEKEGVGLIPLKSGADYLVQEISASSESAVEITVLGEKTPPHYSTAFELKLDLTRYPFLKSHVLDGHAVLPMAMMVEWLAHGALHGNPGFHFHGFDNLKVLKGLTFNGNPPVTLQVLAGRATPKDSFLQVPVELISAGHNGHPLVHARAEIVLSSKLPKGEKSIPKISTRPYPRQNGEIYRDLLFHGPDLHGIVQVKGCSEQGIIARIQTSPPPSQWIQEPLRNRWLADPLALDSSFQMMILWSFENHQAPSLPCFAGRYRQFQSTYPKGEIQVIIRITQDTHPRALADIEFLDAKENLIARIEGYECIIDESLKKAFRKNQLIL